MNRKIFFMLMMPLVIAGCYYDIVQPVDPNAPPNYVSFSGDLQPIFDRECTTSGCHDGSHDPNLLPGFSYNSLVNGGFVNTAIPEKSTIYTILSTGSMPPTGKLPPDEIQKVLDWIKLGAPNN